MNYRIRYYTELEILDSKFQRRMERVQDAATNSTPPSPLRSLVGPTSTLR